MHEWFLKEILIKTKWSLSGVEMDAENKSHECTNSFAFTIGKLASNARMVFKKKF